MQQGLSSGMLACAKAAMWHPTMGPTAHFLARTIPGPCSVPLPHLVVAPGHELDGLVGVLKAPVAAHGSTQPIHVPAAIIHHVLAAPKLTVLVDDVCGGW
jgi:hypothetical protein